MILGPVARGSESYPGPLDELNPVGLGEENGREWPQKGDFNGRMSFAIDSNVLERIGVEPMASTMPLLRSTN